MLISTHYLTLKSAAQRLGVHEQTLRAWERKGLIQLAHLPRSGYRRVPLQEVERIQAAMITENEPSSVRLVPPNRDPEAIEQAYALAKEVEAELAVANSTQTFDEYLASRRGRIWS